MDVDGPDVAGGVTGTAAIGQGVPSWQQAEAGAALERPNVEMTQGRQVADGGELGLAAADLTGARGAGDTPGEWLQVPVGDPRPLYSSRDSSGGGIGGVGAKADPFAAPDNQYRDSWFDTLCINLLSSRMSAALKVEARKSARADASPAANNGMRSERGSAFSSPPAVTLEGVAEAGGVTRDTSGGGGEGSIQPALPATALVEDYFAPETPEGTAVRASDSLEERARGGRRPAVAVISAAASAVMAAAAVAARRGEGFTIWGGPGGGYTYTDYVALATGLQAGPTERQREVVRGVLRSIFPAWFPAFFRTLFPPSKFSAEVNAFMCPPLFSWLVGKSELIDGVVEFKQGGGGVEPGKEVWRSTVKVERCRYLEASKCKGTCMNLCKLPTEAFFKEDLGMPLRMTPNFEDLSCEFAFGQEALAVEDDPLMQERAAAALTMMVVAMIFSH
eukprot:jgi/Undpi1/10220/HiC_scaffold_28.g12673.m1